MFFKRCFFCSAPECGEYKAAMVGYSQPPQPQGPFTVSKSAKVEFKNPFRDTVEKKNIAR